MNQRPISPSGRVVLDVRKRCGKIIKSIKGKCTWCDKTVPAHRETWCSPECVERYQLTQPQKLRQEVYKRDRGICGQCGMDTEKFLAELQTVIADPFHQGHRPVLGLCKLYPALAAVLEDIKKRRTSFWDMDHIEAVGDQGSPFELSNLQTLCLGCHKLKSSIEAARRKLARQTSKVVEPGSAS
jgi:5-methylcytosine-specific restriction endonuclease McrA